MDLTVTINLDNDIFQDALRNLELEGILIHWVRTFDLTDSKLRDSNGNTIGNVEVTE